jgi:acetate kinase
MDDQSFVLVLNAGSSSLKFSVYRVADGDGWRPVVCGQIAGIGTSPRFSTREGGDSVDEHAVDDAVRDQPSALDFLSVWLRDRFHGARVVGVGHRVVHGGPRYAAPVVVSPRVLEDLRTLEPLAPLHQPYNLAAIDAVFQRMPDVPQVACFDTGFHRGRRAVAVVLPLPLEIRRKGVQRYGFHGLSYEYIASSLPRMAPDIARGRVIVAHLGSGASLCALKNGRSVDTSLGFTALDGLCMATRPGALDPGVVLYLFQELGLSASDVERVLYKESGLLGLSGISSDMRELVESEAPNAQLAVDYFVYRAAREIGALAAVLSGIDGLVFTAGIGEHSAEIRRRICEASAWLGVELSAAGNAQNGPRISTRRSAVSAWVIPTNEELLIARHTASLLGLADARALALRA